MKECESFIKALEKAVAKLINYEPPADYPFYAEGSGMSDYECVVMLADTNRRVITRDGSVWQRGKRIQDPLA